MKTFGIIMAGGGGTRFWPLSRLKRPKQLLNLSGKSEMINETAERLKKVLPKENLFVYTARVQKKKVIETSAGRIFPENVIAEPCAKNTAACIAYAAVKIVKEHGDGVMIVSPSDAYIKNEDEYARILGKAATAAEKSDSLITVGIKPTFPATGYGYIKAGETEGEFKRVERFVEKPDLITAEKYVADGGYLWNSGVFIWKASAILKEFEKYLPDIYAEFKNVYSALNTPKESKAANAAYSKIRSVSIDYGIMEKAENVFVAVGDFGWNDVGSWDMMPVLNKTDENNNVVVGDVIAVNVKNSIAYSSGRTVALVDVDNLVVVETADAVLVCPKNKAQNVKKIVEEIKKAGRENLL